MPERTMKVNDRSTRGAGLPKDFNEVIAQFIWNAFEAKATKIAVGYTANEVLGNVQSITIADDGTGINYHKLDQCFGFFLDSPKIRNKNSSQIQGGKGKGRLSFQLFASKAVWHTTYSENDGILKDYDVTILSSRKEKYDPTSPVISNKKHTGTTVEFLTVNNIHGGQFASDDFLDFLRKEFGWYLHLNKDRHFTISVNGEELDYKTIVKTSKKVAKSFDDEDANKSYSFTIDYIQWNKKIGDQNYFYYLNTDQEEVFKDFTSFNKSGGGAYGFYHSVYITSDFFDAFDSTSEDGTQTSLLANCKSNSAYKALMTYLKEDLLKKRKEYYKEAASKVWQGFEEKKTLPEYGNTELDKVKKESLKQVVEGLYTIEPTIFLNLKPQQEKTMLGLMDLVLDTDEKDNVVKIVDSIVNDLTPEEREEFAKLLDQIKLNSINDMLRLVVSREKVIETLKTMVFDLKKFANERDHIQSAIESSTWLFGEEFTNVSFDKDFEESLRAYAYLLDGYTEKQTIDDPSKKRRMDVFLCRQRLVNDPNYGNTSQLEENIIVELKRPSVTLGTTQLRQVQDYRNIIKQNKQFHSQMKVWKFFLVSSDVDDTIKAAYQSFENRGKRFLVDWQQDFEIYALTWSDIFDVYRIRNQFLLSKLNIDKKMIKEEIAARTPGLSKAAADNLTELVHEEALPVT